MPAAEKMHSTPTEEKGAARYYFREMFPAGAGPHVTKMDKKANVLEQLATEGAREIEEAVRAVDIHHLAGDSQFVGMAIAQKRKGDLRVMQEKAKEPQKRRRCVQLKD